MKALMPAACNSSSGTPVAHSSQTVAPTAARRASEKARDQRVQAKHRASKHAPWADTWCGARAL
jgi:hypothetical protein